MSRISDLAGFTTSLSTTEDLSVGIVTANKIVSGIITGATSIEATVFYGSGSGLTGVASTDNIQTSTDANFLANVSIGGSLTVNGNFTRINTEVLDIEDKKVGIASTSTPTSLTQDGAGIEIYGETPVTVTYERDKAAVSISTALNVTGFVTATTYYGDGSNLDGISAGIGTESSTPNNTITFLDLSSAQDHKLTVSGITTISVTGGTEGDSHTVRITNSGITTIGFTTYFLWPSGSTPSLPTADGAKSLISFTVNRVGGAGTELFTGASVNFS